MCAPKPELTPHKINKHRDVNIANACAMFWRSAMLCVIMHFFVRLAIGHAIRRGGFADLGDKTRINATTAKPMVTCCAAKLTECGPAMDAAILAIDDRVLGLGYCENTWPTNIPTKHHANKQDCHLTDLLEKLEQQRQKKNSMNNRTPSDNARA